MNFFVMVKVILYSLFKIFTRNIYCLLCFIIKKSNCVCNIAEYISSGCSGGITQCCSVLILVILSFIQHLFFQHLRREIHCAQALCLWPLLYLPFGYLQWVRRCVKCFTNLTN